MADASADDIFRVLQNLVLAVNAQTQKLSLVLPAVSSTAGTATAGAATLPSNPVGFLAITLPNGTSARVPYYNV